MFLIKIIQNKKKMKKIKNDIFLCFINYKNEFNL